MSTTDAPVSQTVADFSAKLDGFTDQQLDRPTRADRDAFMAVRDSIKDTPRDGLSEQDNRDISFLYIRSTHMANRQEDFYEANGNKFAE